MKVAATSVAILLLCVGHGSSGMAHALHIDYEIRGTAELWSANYHTPLWLAVIGRMENMIRVIQPDPYPAGLLPAGGTKCGPRGTEALAPRHTNSLSNVLTLATNDTLVVYIYTDTLAPDCSNGSSVIAYASTCATHSATHRPVMGYINFCNPAWSTMYTLMAHEVMHLIGFADEMFSTSFDAFDVLGTIGINPGPIGGGGSAEGPFVSFLRDHYACAQAHAYGHMLQYGMLMTPRAEGGAHFNPLLVGNEVMTPCVSGEEHRITEITAKVLEGLGYLTVNSQGAEMFQHIYSVDYTYVDKFVYGLNLGCRFLPFQCDQPTVQLLIDGQVSPFSFECVNLCVAGAYSDQFINPLTIDAAMMLATFEPVTISSVDQSTTTPAPSPPTVQQVQREMSIRAATMAITLIVVGSGALWLVPPFITI